MKTIQKRADELKPGDVFVPRYGNQIHYIALSAFEKSAERGIVKVFAMFAKRMESLVCEPETPVVVEAPALTPAQEHAEELLHWTRLMFDFIESPATAFYNEYRDGVRDLLAKIDPPKAPEYEELLKALDSINPEHLPPWTIYLLERARRAQVYP